MEIPGTRHPMRALRDTGLRVPDDVSVVGFFDIQGAAFQNPGLTTIRQPLRRMGEIAAEIPVQRISKTGAGRKRATVEPELIVRQSTAGGLGGATLPLCVGMLGEASGGIGWGLMVPIAGSLAMLLLVTVEWRRIGAPRQADSYRKSDEENG